MPSNHSCCNRLKDNTCKLSNLCKGSWSRGKFGGSVYIVWWFRVCTLSVDPSSCLFVRGLWEPLWALGFSLSLSLCSTFDEREAATTNLWESRKLFHLVWIHPFLNWAGKPIIVQSRIGAVTWLANDKGTSISQRSSELKNSYALPLPTQLVHWQLKASSAVLFWEKFSVVGLHGRTESVWRLALRPRSGLSSCSTTSSLAFNRWLTSTSGPLSEPRRAGEGLEGHRRHLTGADPHIWAVPSTQSGTKHIFWGRETIYSNSHLLPTCYDTLISDSLQPTFTFLHTLIPNNQQLVH